MVPEFLLKFDSEAAMVKSILGPHRLNDKNSMKPMTAQDAQTPLLGIY